MAADVAVPCTHEPPEEKRRCKHARPADELKSRALFSVASMLVLLNRRATEAGRRTGASGRPSRHRTAVPLRPRRLPVLAGSLAALDSHLLPIPSEDEERACRGRQWEKRLRLTVLSPHGFFFSLSPMNEILGWGRASDFIEGLCYEESLAISKNAKSIEQLSQSIECI